MRERGGGGEIAKRARGILLGMGIYRGGGSGFFFNRGGRGWVVQYILGEPETEYSYYGIHITRYPVFFMAQPLNEMRIIHPQVDFCSLPTTYEYSLSAKQILVFARNNPSLSVPTVLRKRDKQLSPLKWFHLEVCSLSGFLFSRGGGVKLKAVWRMSLSWT